MTMDQADAVEFRLCPKEALEGIGWAAGIGAALAGFMYWRSGAAGLPIGLGLAALMVGVAILQYVRASHDRSVHVRLDAFGLHAPKAMHAPVAWARISRIDFIRPRRQPLTMRVFLDHPSATGSSATGIFGAMYRAFQIAPISLPVDDLEGEPQAIMEAIRRFSPATLVTF